MFFKGLIFAFLFCRMQSSPINLNAELHDEVDDLLERAQKLLTSIENEIAGEVRVLETYISDIVTTEITTKSNGTSRLKSDVYDLVRMIELIMEQAAEEGTDISDCTKNSIAIIQTAAEDAEKNITNYTEETADQGVETIGNNIIEINSQLSIVEKCLVATEECKLKEDIEQAVCAAELSVQLSNLESNIPKNINNIITNSSLFYSGVVNDLKTNTKKYLDEFFEVNLEIVKTIITCANSKLPVPLTTPWLPTIETTTWWQSTTTGIWDITTETWETTTDIWETTTWPPTSTTENIWDTTTETWETTTWPPTSTTENIWDTTTETWETTTETWETTADIWETTTETWETTADIWDTTTETWETTAWPATSTTENIWDTTTETSETTTETWETPTGTWETTTDIWETTTWPPTSTTENNWDSTTETWETPTETSETTTWPSTSTTEHSWETPTETWETTTDIWETTTWPPTGTTENIWEITPTSGPLTPVKKYLLCFYEFKNYTFNSTCH